MKTTWGAAMIKPLRQIERQQSNPPRKRDDERAERYPGGFAAWFSRFSDNVNTATPPATLTSLEDMVVVMSQVEAEERRYRRSFRSNPYASVAEDRERRDHRQYVFPFAHAGLEGGSLVNREA